MTRYALAFLAAQLLLPATQVVAQAGDPGDPGTAPPPCTNNPSPPSDPPGGWELLEVVSNWKSEPVPIALKTGEWSLDNWTRIEYNCGVHHFSSCELVPGPNEIDRDHTTTVQESWGVSGGLNVNVDAEVAAGFELLAAVKAAVGVTMTIEGSLSGSHTETNSTTTHPVLLCGQVYNEERWEQEWLGTGSREVAKKKYLWRVTSPITLYHTSYCGRKMLNANINKIQGFRYVADIDECGICTCPPNP